METYLSLLKKQKFFIDFESNKSDEVFLLGIKSNDEFKLWVINEKLKPLINNPVYQKQFNIDFTDKSICISRLIEELKISNGIIVAYSSAEKRILEKLFPEIIENKIIPYLDLRKATSRWINKYHKERFEEMPSFRKSANAFYQKRLDNSLASVTRLIDNQFHAMHDYGPLKTTSRINSVINGIYNNRNKENSFNNLTAVQKGKATKLLKHNKFDVEAMDILTTHIIEKDKTCFRKAFSYLNE